MSDVTVFSHETHDASCPSGGRHASIFWLDSFLLLLMLPGASGASTAIISLEATPTTVCLYVALYIVGKRCVLKEQKLLLAAYRNSYIRNRLVPK